MKIFVLNDGNTIGPLDFESLHAAVGSGEILRTAPAWQDGADAWTDVDSLLSAQDKPFQERAATTLEEPMWFYLGQQNDTVGPISQNELLQLIAQRILLPRTYVCMKGMEAWITAGEALQELAKQAEPPRSQPHPHSPRPTRDQVKRSGVWWPQSSLGSALAAVLLSYLSILAIEKGGLVLATFRHNGLSGELFAALVSLLLVSAFFVSVYGFTIFVRYACIVAPFKREARKQGLAWKMPFLERIVANPRPFILAGFATATTMGIFLVLALGQAANAHDEIEASGAATQNLQSSARDVEEEARKIAYLRRMNEQQYDRERRNGDPYARESYLKAKAELDQMEAAIESRATMLVERGTGHLSDALLSANTRDSLKVVQIWTTLGCIGGFAFAAYVSLQSRRAKNERATA